MSLFIGLWITSLPFLHCSMCMQLNFIACSTPAVPPAAEALWDSSTARQLIRDDRTPLVALYLL